MCNLSDTKLEKPIYISLKITYQGMADALDEAKAKMGIQKTNQLIRQLIWNKAKDIQ